MSHNPICSQDELVPVCYLIFSLDEYNMPYYQELRLLGRSYGLEIFYVCMGDFNFTDCTVRGEFFDGNETYRKSVPIPRLINNAIPPSWLSQGFRASLAAAGACLLRVEIKLSKYQQALKLAAEGGMFEPLAIESVVIGSLSKIDEAFENLQTDTLFFKPLFGTHGNGAYKLERYEKEGERAYVLYDHDKGNTRADFSNIEDIAEYFVANTDNKKYVVQKAVNSYTSQGDAFNIRVIIQRGSQGKKEFSFWGRVGEKGSIVANLHAGGVACDAESFLRIEFGEAISESIIADLTEIALESPEMVEEISINRNYRWYNLGLDMGIERDDSEKGYKLKMFEINAFPAHSGDLKKTHLAIAECEYINYIWRGNTLI